MILKRRVNGNINNQYTEEHWGEYTDLLNWHKERVSEIYSPDVAKELHLKAIEWVVKARAFDNRKINRK